MAGRISLPVGHYISHIARKADRFYILVLAESLYAANFVEVEVKNVNAVFAAYKFVCVVSAVV